jgi:hypothetical protein
MDLCGTRLVHATAQPICRITDGDVTTAIFGQTAGIPAEFLFEDSKASISSATGVSSEVGNGRILVSNIRPGTQAAVRIDKPGGRSVIVVVLTEELSRMIYKERLGGRDRVFLACSGLTADGDTLRLSSVDSDVLSVSILPAPLSLSCAARAVAETDDGVFRNYALPVVRQRIDAVVEPVKSAGPARIVPIGSQGVAQAPDDADFSEAGVWRIALPPEVDSNRDITLRVRYRGDVARVYSGSRLLTDSFYNGRPFDIALKQFGPEAYSSDLRLEILPIRADSPVYFEPDVRSSIDRTESSIELCGVDVLETVTVSLTV